MPTEFREEPCKTALNRVRGMGAYLSWSLNPYMGCAHRCTFCYVRAFELRADRPSDERYGSSIRVKTNIVDVLSAELTRRWWKRETVTIGAATDPYQPAEGRYRLTRRCIEALAAACTPLSIITRGPLIVRDIDVLAEASRHIPVRVSFSIPTPDPAVWRTTEPGTAPPAQRLRALERLAAAGIDAGVSLAPILPGLSDQPGQLEAVVRAARDAGATHLWCGALHLRPGTREHFLRHLAVDWPELVVRYEGLYVGTYLGKPEEEHIYEMVSGLEQRYGLTARRTPPSPPPSNGPRQLTLFG